MSMFCSCKLFAAHLYMACVYVTISNSSSPFRMKNGVEVPTGVRSRYRVKCEGTKHFLVIDDASREDTGTYSVMATGGTSEAHIQVDCM